MADDALERFSDPVRTWFRTSFRAPTPAQARGWPAIADGDHTLILAPTGSGKTLTAFLWAIDRLTSAPPPPPDQRLRVVYISPLRALAVDVDRNLRAPLEGIRLAAERLGTRVHRPTVGVRTGDTSSQERARLTRTPPDILITTPESLYLLLTSQARRTLRHVEAVIVDEIHALAATKRGSHLALSLERLEHEVTRGHLGDDPATPAAPGAPGASATGGGAPTAARRPPQRIALSATQRPLEELARFLGGSDLPTPGPTSPPHPPTPAHAPPEPTPRPVTIVDAGATKPLELEVVVPVEDMGELGSPVTDPTQTDTALAAAGGPVRRSIWPAVHPRLLELVLAHRSTLIFVNARRLAERLAAKLNELHAQQQREAALRAAGLTGDELHAALAEPDDAPVEELVMAHHGSLSRERRLAVEDQLKAGELRALVATSSLELGIDMGAVDLVVQVASPGSVSRGLQRVGRAGHQVDAPSRGVLVPRYRGDLVETAVVARGMHLGDIEPTRYPRLPLDVLAQQIVAMVAVEPWQVDELATVVRRAAPFTELTDAVLHAVLDLLAGRYPSEEFSELRPRIVWDRVAGVLTARQGAQRLAVTNAGTIPDRGLFGVFLPDGTRVGELDEEMVHESRTGETFVLGASTWRIEDITHERVVVQPAPGQPGKLPFWHGDGPGRPAPLGRAVGAFMREVRTNAARDRGAEVARLQAEHDLDAWAASNLVGYLDEQAAATGAVPDDRTIVVERFRDELGDWRVCILSPFGARVHAPWAMAIERRLVDRGEDPEVMWADDGIVVGLQEAAEPHGALLEDLLVDPDELEPLVVAQLAATARFTTAFREAAGRALLLPRRMPGRRTALWQQRQRAARLLEVASRYPSFPNTLEATRECLQDIFDLPALTELLTALRARQVRVVEVESSSASPFAQSLLFGWVGQYMYEYDAPLAERRAAALALDRDLLRELLGGDELRELLDLDVLDALERELQHLAPTPPDQPGQRSRSDQPDAGVDPGYDPRARDADELHDVLRRVGDLSRVELAERAVTDPTGWIEQLLTARRAIEVRVAGHDRIAAAEDAARLRDGLGAAIPTGLPQAFTTPVDDPLAELVARYARSHGPFLATDVADRLGVPPARVLAALRWLERSGRVLAGGFRPGGVAEEWIDAEVLRRAKRRSLAALRAEVEPVDAATLGRFLPAWHQVRGAAGVGRRRGVDALADAIGLLQAVPIPASVLERDVLPARVEGYRPSDLDQLLATGEVVWVGMEPLGARDGRVVLCFRDQVGLLLAPPADRAQPPDDAAQPPDDAAQPPDDAIHQALLTHLASRGASFFPALQAATGVADQEQILTALWDLVWAGLVTNDTYAPLRSLLRGGRGSGSGARGSAGSRRGGRPRPGQLQRTGPPAAQGRWSLTAELHPVPAPTATERRHGQARQLLERHGVLTREALRVEAVEGGYAALSPVLRALEESGQVRRGYAVDGLGAAQFALPGAIDRLRGLRRRADDDEPVTTVWLAATDPAQPYGAALPWPPSPGRPARSAGALVLLVDGQPALLVERAGTSLVSFDHPLDPAGWLGALAHPLSEGRWRKLEVRRVDGTDVHDSPWADRLRAAGFHPGPRGLVLRAGLP